MTKIDPFSLTTIPLEQKAFLAVVERVLPEQFLETITRQRVFAKQPGALY
ncbi:hypothetical protein [Bradyrhizobium cytisi]|nr:hypothetical protein [Bradyrhizobium cytisi]